MEFKKKKKIPPEDPITFFAKTSNWISTLCMI